MAKFGTASPCEITEIPPEAPSETPGLILEIFAMETPVEFFSRICNLPNQTLPSTFWSNWQVIVVKLEESHEHENDEVVDEEVDKMVDKLLYKQHSVQ